MKQIILALVLVVMFTTSAMAQNVETPGKNIDSNKREMIFNAKVKHLQEKLMLSPEQVEKVIPVYKEYMQEIRNLPRIKRGSKDTEFTTTDQAYDYVKSHLDHKKAIVNSQEKCILKLKPILNPQQLVSFLRVEHEIQKKIMHERKKRGHPVKGQKPRLEKRDRK